MGQLDLPGRSSGAQHIPSFTVEGQILAQPLTSRLTLGKSLSLPEAVSSSVKWGLASLAELWKERSLGDFTEHRECSIIKSYFLIMKLRNIMRSR